MHELPESLKNRFILYLNVMPILEKIGLYGSFICGMILTMFAITRAAFRLSTSMSASKNISNNHHKYNSNLTNSAIYNACEERLMSDDECKPIAKSKFIHKDDTGFCINIDANEKINTTGSCEFELENEAALSDIEYDDDDSSDQSSSNSIQEIKRLANRNNLVSEFEKPDIYLLS